MPNNKQNNLMPIQEVNSRRSREQHSEDSRKGGVKSGEVRRERKKIADQINLLLSLPFPDIQDKKGRQLKQTFYQLGIDPDNIDNQMAMVISMWQKAIKGDVQAFNTLRDTVGEKPKETITIDNSIDETINEVDEYLCRKKKKD